MPNIRDLMTEAVKHRYLHTGVDTSTCADSSKHRVVDNFIPLAFTNTGNINDTYGAVSDSNIQRATSWDNAVVISELNYMLMGGKVRLKTVPEVVYDILGYTPEQIKEALETIKSKKLDVVLVGYGGFNINATHVWTKITQDLNVETPFASLTVFESDVLKFSNTLRLIKDSTAVQCAVGQNIPKVLLGLKDFEVLAGRNASYQIQYLTTPIAEQLVKDLPNIVFYGAPDFTTRDVLKEHNFIFAGHSGDSSVLYSRPIVDGSITTETYGTIDLNTFFINVIKASTESLLVLAKGDKLERDTLLLNYSCRDDKAVTAKLNLGEVQNG